MAKPLVEKMKRIVTREARIAGRSMLELSENMTTDGLNLTAIFGKADHVVKEQPH